MATTERWLTLCIASMRWPGDYEKDLGLQKPGATLNYTFDKAGQYRVRCNIHPSIKMAVTVN